MLVVMTGVRVRMLMRDGQAEPVRSLAILATSAAEAERSNRNWFSDAVARVFAGPFFEGSGRLYSSVRWEQPEL